MVFTSILVDQSFQIGGESEHRIQQSKKSILVHLFLKIIFFLLHFYMRCTEHNKRRKEFLIIN